MLEKNDGIGGAFQVDSPEPAAQSWRAVAWPLVLLAAAVFGIGTYAYWAAKLAVTQDVAGDMKAVATLKAAQIEQWLTGRRDDIRLIGTAQLSRDLQQWLAGDQRNDDLKQRLLEQLTFTGAIYHREVSLLSPVDGHLLLTTGSHPDTAAIRVQAVDVARRGTATLEDLHFAEGGSPSKVDVGIFGLLFAVGSGSDGKVLAVIHLSLDPGERLFRLLQVWPGTSQSAETLLLRYDGDDIVFLNPLRHVADSALRLRRPRTTPHFIAGRLIRDGAGFFEGDDYRGMPSLAYGLPVAGTPWFLVAKKDRAEAYAKLDAIAMFSAALLGVLLLACAWWLVERRRAAAVQQRLNRALRLLSHCNMTLVRAVSEPELLNAICRLTVETGGYRMAWVGSPVQDADRTVEVVSRFGPEAAYLDGVRISWGDNEWGRGPTGTAIRTRTTQANQDIGTNPVMLPWRAAALARGFQSSIALPLASQGSVFGALTIYAAEPQAFGAEEVKLLEELAGDLAFGIEFLRAHAAQRQAEQALRDNQDELRIGKAFFKSSFDSAAVGMVVADADLGHVLMTNKAYCATVGYTEHELLGRQLGDLTHADDHAADVDEMPRLLSGDAATYIREKRLIHSSGREVWVLLAVALIRDHGGEPMYFVSQVIDVTARKQMEQALMSSREQLRQMATYELSLREAERKRIARELHDELGQMLTGIKMDLSLLRASVAASPDLAERLQATNGLVDATLASVRRISADLRPMMLDELGLKAALEWMTEEFAKRYRGISCRLAFDIEDYCPDDAMSITVYRIVQECLTNVARHAQANTVEVAIGLRDWEWLVIKVSDDGRGLPVPAREGGFGLLGMRERVNVLRGRFDLISRPGAGVTVEVAIPLDVTAVAGAGQ